MDKSLRNTLINSTLAFISAFFMTTFIHEFGHFISYYLFGTHPVLFHNYVQTPDQELSFLAQVFSALAGPLISLVQGIIFAFILSSSKKNTVIHLLYLWLSLLGFVNFFGYLMMTPLSTSGDTGKVAELMQIGHLYRILIAIAGLIVIILIILKMGKHFSNFIPAQNQKGMKRKYVYQIMFYPILIGSVVNTIFAFPIPVILSAIYPATSSFVIMTSFGIILRSPGTLETKTNVQNKISGSMLSLTFFWIIVNRLLTLGIG